MTPSAGAVGPDVALTDSQRVLLRAALLGTEAARSSWLHWQRDPGLDDVGEGEYQLLPQVHANLIARCGDPDGDGSAISDRSRLNGISKRAWFLASLVQRSLERALERLERRGVPSLVHGGLDLLAVGLCPPRARHVDVASVLVRSDRLDDADDALRADGWRPHAALPDGRLRRVACHALYTKEGEQPLRVWWRAFSDDVPSDIEDRLWQASVEHSIGDQVTRLLSPTSLVVVACSQMSTGVYGVPRLLCDLACVIGARGDAIDWAYVQSAAERLRLLGPLRAALRVLAEDFETAVPRSLLEARASTSDHASLPYLGGRGVRADFSGLWERYAAVDRTDGRRASLVRFGSFTFSYCRYVWGLPSPWQVPVVAPVRWYRSLRDPEAG